MSALLSHSGLAPSRIGAARSSLSFPILICAPLPSLSSPPVSNSSYRSKKHVRGRGRGAIPPIRLDSPEGKREVLLVRDVHDRVAQREEGGRLEVALDGVEARRGAEGVDPFAPCLRWGGPGSWISPEIPSWTELAAPCGAPLSSGEGAAPWTTEGQSRRCGPLRCPMTVLGWPSAWNWQPHVALADLHATRRKWRPRPQRSSM